MSCCQSGRVYESRERYASYARWHDEHETIAYVTGLRENGRHFLASVVYVSYRISLHVWWRTSVRDDNVEKPRYRHIVLQCMTNLKPPPLKYFVGHWVTSSCFVLLAILINNLLFWGIRINSAKCNAMVCFCRSQNFWFKRFSRNSYFIQISSSDFKGQWGLGKFVW